MYDSFLFLISSFVTTVDQLLFSRLRPSEVPIYMASVAQYNYCRFKIYLEVECFYVAETITSTDISRSTNKWMTSLKLCLSVSRGT